MIPGRVTIRALAARDLTQHADWLRTEAGEDTAERFLAAAAETFDLLATSPGLGPPVFANAPELASAQKWRVQGFPALLIFYLSRPGGGIAVLRVLHSAQNWLAR